MYRNIKIEIAIFYSFYVMILVQAVRCKWQELKQNCVVCQKYYGIEFWLWCGLSTVHFINALSIKEIVI